MTNEPVAYLSKYLDNSTNITRYKPENQRVLSSTPLYTAEDLHPRVKMTKKQYEEWQSAIRSIYPVNLYELFNLIFNTAEHQGGYEGMRDIFSFNEGQKKLAQLWADFDPENPEETIEIVPNMKWFVRSKERDDEGDYAFLSGSNLDDLEYFGFDYARPFDTKEEAELWLNPLTEAVQLPVERSNE